MVKRVKKMKKGVPKDENFQISKHQFPLSIAPTCFFWNF